MDKQSEAEMFANYLRLIDKVDEKFAEIAAAAVDRMVCQQGCHSCCLPDLSVSMVEAAFIRSQLRDRPALRKQALAAAEADAFQGGRCRFLDTDGRCSIYEVRPLICRSHGVPIRFRSNEGHLSKDVCELNFTDQDLESIDEGHFINLELLNTLLALVNEKEFGEAGRDRIPLDPRVILARN